MAVHGDGRESNRALSAPAVDPLAVAVPLLLNELAGSAQQVALILDDYHVLGSARIHEGVEFLVSYLPTRRCPWPAFGPTCCDSNLVLPQPAGATTTHNRALDASSRRSRRFLGTSAFFGGGTVSLTAAEATPLLAVRPP